MNNSVYLYGASGHAKVIIEILKSQGMSVAGLFDDNPAINRLWDYEVRPFVGEAYDAPFIITIGNNRVRCHLAQRIYVAFTTAIHSKSIISPTANIGNGTVVMPGACINADAVIGKHCIVNTNCSIDHECRIEDYAHISPNATLCGNVTVGEGTHIGAGAVILPGITVGNWAVIGAGAVVTKPVASGTIVVGNPARVK
ncbi:acetyltransferase [Chitinophaga silvatica]|uniref:Acetyltransferase n=1 Tax=Chitinophaga silvatica TaxID=2282649 RepID=A0A3E1Y9F2_9BACT|nr:acetyltransferase [Chitinophaga silvatica]RFS22027.1 acetyltransferase [Chitinophaga silvatica]